MYDELYKPETYEFMNVTDGEEISKILSTYMDKYYDVTDKDTWFPNRARRDRKQDTRD